jgi:hypothetical protein
VIDYDFRDILTPLVDYIERVNHEEFPDRLITIVIPEFVVSSTLAQVLHNQTANLLRRQLHARQDIIMIDVPYHISTNGMQHKTASVSETDYTSTDITKLE